MGYSPWGPKELDMTEHLTLSAAAAKSLQSCPTLCDPIDCSPPGSFVQARILDWVAISYDTAFQEYLFFTSNVS